MSRYSAKTGELKKKHRDICYAAHIDRCIFQLYNFGLNEYYNDGCDRLGIGDTAVAYRTNLDRQNNIDFAKKALQFIRESRDSYIMIGDFTNFFDNLDHLYLKKQWCALLHTDRLPADHYAVFKNITGYSYMELTDLLAVYDLSDNRKGRQEFNSQERVLSMGELKEKGLPIHKNKNRGIPQGSPISGVLLRIDEARAIDLLTRISDLFNSSDYPGLKLEPNKTQYDHFHENQIENCGTVIHKEADTSNRDFLNFLGFAFDGDHVNLRAKTISKYYRRMRRKAKNTVKSERYVNRIRHGARKDLYKRYSVRGAASGSGNFLTYVKRAQGSGRFGESEGIEMIRKRNMAKVAGFLKREDA